MTVTSEPSLTKSATATESRSSGEAGKQRENRDERSDFLKAAAIVGVVCIHAGVPYADVFRFCVPIFVALWAFHLEHGLARRDPTRHGGYLARRLLGLFVPYAFWSLLYSCLFHHVDELWSTPLHTIVGGWFGGYGWSGQYFFIILIQWTFLMPLLRRWVTPAMFAAALVGAMIFDVAADYFFFRNRIVSGVDDRLFVYWVPYVILGIAFARGYPPRMPLLVPIAALVLAVCPWEIGRLKETVPAASAYLTVSAVIGSCALLLGAGPRLPSEPSRKRRRGPVLRGCLHVGRNSFAIFVAHVLVLDLLRRSGTAFDDSALGIVGRIGTVVVAIAGSMVVAWVLRRLRLGILVGG